jgi:RNA polymerase sigma-70 factor (ECF subfamily)
MHLSGDHSLADELTGETFYRAMLALDSFRGEASVRTWLFRIVRNLYFPVTLRVSYRGDEIILPYIKLRS